MLNTTHLDIPGYLHQILLEIRKRGGDPYLVGGAVRDHFLKIAPKDFDFEVYHLSIDKLKSILSRFGELGFESGFPVVVLRTNSNVHEFALPRIETKSGSGYRGFSVTVDPNMKKEIALLRRDYTINAMMLSLDGNLVDPYAGLTDLKNKVLRHVSQSYSDDPVRIVRGLHLASRFDLTPHKSTLDLAKGAIREIPSVSVDKLWYSWSQWALSNYPTKGLDFLLRSGWIYLYPALRELPYIAQDAKHHPEGNVWNHIVEVVSRMAVLSKNQNNQVKIKRMFAALLHDSGKYEATRVKGGKIVSHGHEKNSIHYVRPFMEQIGINFIGKDKSAIIQAVERLVETHMRFISGEVTKRGVGKLIRDLDPANMEDWYALVMADCGELDRKKGRISNARRAYDLSKELKANSGMPPRIINGNHVMQHTDLRGPAIGEVLRTLYIEQLNGYFDNEEDGISRLKQFTRNKK